jgi:hypothetical protein
MNTAEISRPRAALPTLSFHLVMAVIIAASVFYGFSRTIGASLIHPAQPAPTLVYVHAGVFFLWPVLLVIQSALVNSRSLQLHRTLGWWFAAVGVAVPVIGAATAILSAQAGVARGNPAALPGLLIPLFNMLSFAILFGLAVLWREKADRHPRLMLLATCTLTSAAFGRFPAFLVPPGYFFVAVDVLLAAAVAHDLVTSRRVHPVNLVAVPVLVAGQFIAWHGAGSPLWISIAQALAG